MLALLRLKTNHNESILLCLTFTSAHSVFLYLLNRLWDSGQVVERVPTSGFREGLARCITFCWNNADAECVNAPLGAAHRGQKAEVALLVCGLSGLDVKSLSFFFASWWCCLIKYNEIQDTFEGLK